MSVLEAISCGCKAILSDIPSHREIVKLLPSKAALIHTHDKLLLNTSESELSHYYISSKRMADEYLLIYKGSY